MTEHSGHEAASTLLDSRDLPSVIMAGNDLMAPGIMSAIHERRLRVGEDIVVGGFNDLPLVGHIHPSLTTVRRPIYQTGQQLNQPLLHLIGGQPSAKPAVLVQPQLLVRVQRPGDRPVIFLRAFLSTRPDCLGGERINRKSVEEANYRGSY